MRVWGQYLQLLNVWRVHEALAIRGEVGAKIIRNQVEHIAAAVVDACSELLQNEEEEEPKHSCRSPTAATPLQNEKGTPT